MAPPGQLVLRDRGDTLKALQSHVGYFCWCFDTLAHDGMLVKRVACKRGGTSDIIQETSVPLWKGVEGRYSMYRAAEGAERLTRRLPDGYDLGPFFCPYLGSLPTRRLRAGRCEGRSEIVEARGEGEEKENSETRRKDEAWLTLMMTFRSTAATCRSVVLASKSFGGTSREPKMSLKRNACCYDDMRDGSEDAA